MRTKSRPVVAVPAEVVRQRSRGIVVIPSADPTRPSEEDAEAPVTMAQVNGIQREQRESTPIDTSVVPPGRVISTSMMRQAAVEQPLSPDSTQWSAIGHASTGKSGRVIERLQQEIDRLNREKQLLKLRYEEAERASETLHTQYRYLQDRNSNYESSHEANLRQLQRKERQVEELREELNKEKERTARVERALHTAAINENEWREQASQAKSTAQQKEAEYDAIAACRNMDNDRHQNGLNRIKAALDELLRKREEDLEKQQRIEILAEQRKQEIEHLEELTKKLQANFNAYRSRVDTAIQDLRSAASENDRAVQEKVEEMRRVTGEMKWLMNVEITLNGRPVPVRQSRAPQETQSDERSSNTAQSEEDCKEKAVEKNTPPSPSKKLSLDFRRHRRKGSTKSGK